MGITVAEYRELVKQQKNPRIRVSAKQDRTFDGIVFDSKKEMQRYQELLLLSRQKKIQWLEVHPAFELQPKFKKNGKVYRAIKYEADFKYYDMEKQKFIVEDVKGMKTEKFLLKAKMFEYQYPELSLVLI